MTEVVTRLRWFFANLVEVKLSQDAGGGQMSVVNSSARRVICRHSIFTAQMTRLGTCSKVR
jgi:hypothetical protein